MCATSVSVSVSVTTNFEHVGESGQRIYTRYVEYFT